MNEEDILNILKEEIVPAEGCTEPIAIAYVAAKAREVLGEEPKKLKVFVSGNIIKNVKSVVIPNSGGLVGIESAAVIGALAGDSAKDLMVINEVSADDIERVKNFLKTDNVEVIHAKNDIKLYIKIEAISKNNVAGVEVKHFHTNITKITKNGKRVVKRICNEHTFNSPLTDRNQLSIQGIYDLAKTIDLQKIEPIFK